MLATQRPRNQPHHHLIMLRTPPPSLLPLMYAPLLLSALHLPPRHPHRCLVCQNLLQLRPPRALHSLHQQMSQFKVCRQNSKPTFATDASPLPEPSSHSLSEGNAGVPQSQTDATVDVAASSVNPGQQGKPRRILVSFLTRLKFLSVDQRSFR